MTEEWRSIPGWEGSHEASSLGRIRSLPGFRNARNGHKARVPGCILRPSMTKEHAAITLNRDGRERREYVHRLVLSAFVGPCPDGMEGCHFDGNPLNNAIWNLRWDTRSANHLDKRRHGTMLVGERHHKTTITEEMVRALRADVGTYSVLGAKYGISRSAAHCVKTGKTWAHVK